MEIFKTLDDNVNLGHQLRLKDPRCIDSSEDACSFESNITWDEAPKKTRFSSSMFFGSTISLLSLSTPTYQKTPKTELRGTSSLHANLHTSCCPSKEKRSNKRVLSVSSISGAFRGLFKRHTVVAESSNTRTHNMHSIREKEPSVFSKSSEEENTIAHVVSRDRLRLSAPLRVPRYEMTDLKDEEKYLNLTDIACIEHQARIWSLRGNFVQARRLRRRAVVYRQIYFARRNRRRNYSLPLKPVSSGIGPAVANPLPRSKSDPGGWAVGRSSCGLSSMNRFRTVCWAMRHGTKQSEQAAYQTVIHKFVPRVWNPVASRLANQAPLQSDVLPAEWLAAAQELYQLIIGVTPENNTRAGNGRNV
jgi:hypothetical protein